MGSEMCIRDRWRANHIDTRHFPFMSVTLASHLISPSRASLSSTRLVRSPNLNIAIFIACSHYNGELSARPSAVFAQTVGRTGGGLAYTSGSALVSINEVNLHRARLVLGWVTASGFSSRCGAFISVCNQPPRSTQPGRPFVVSCNEYQLKGVDALRRGSKGRYGCLISNFMVRHVKLCDPLVTRGPYLSALETHVWHYEALYKFNFFVILCSILCPFLAVVIQD